MPLLNCHSAVVVPAVPAAKKASKPTRQQQFQLPVSLVPQILQYVPLAECMSACAPVSRDWAAAAVEATTQLKLCFPDGKTSNRLAILEQYLSKHTSKLQSFDFGFGARRLLGIPKQLTVPFGMFLNLQSLLLHGVDLQSSFQINSSGSSGGMAVLQATTSNAPSNG